LRLVRGERAAPAPDLGARLSVSDGLVGDEGPRHGSDESEGGEGRHLRRDGEQPEQQDRRHRSAVTQTAADPQAKGDVPDEVQGDAAAEADRRHDQERCIELVDRGLQPEREQHDARDHRQVQVRVRISCERGASRPRQLAEPGLGDEDDPLEI
jgi:hypothetical protein